MLDKNTETSYSSLSKFFHMAWGLMVIACYSSLYYKEYFLEKKAPLGKFLIVNIHKPVGTLLLIMMCFAFAWHLKNKKPKYSESMAAWEKKLAYFVQKLLYFFLMFMPLSGFLMSTASAYPVSMFGLFKMPLLFSKNKELAGLLYEAHGYLAWLGLALIALHLGGVLKQEILRKDPVTKKMLPKFFFRK